MTDEQKLDEMIANLDREEEARKVRIEAAFAQMAEARAELRRLLGSPVTCSKEA